MSTLDDLVKAAIDWEREWWTDHPAPDATMKKVTRAKLEEAVQRYLQEQHG